LKCLGTLIIRKLLVSKFHLGHPNHGFQRHWHDLARQLPSKANWVVLSQNARGREGVCPPLICLPLFVRRGFRASYPGSPDCSSSVLRWRMRDARLLSFNPGIGRGYRANRIPCGVCECWKHSSLQVNNACTPRTQYCAAHWISISDSLSRSISNRLRSYW